MTILQELLALHEEAELKTGYYILDSSDHIGSGPYRNIELAKKRKLENEVVAFWSGKKWNDVD